MQRVRRERYDSEGDNVEEIAKRKRELLGEGTAEKDEREVFKKGKKMVRSPVKGSRRRR